MNAHTMHLTTEQATRIGNECDDRDAHAVYITESNDRNLIVDLVDDQNNNIATFVVADDGEIASA